MPHSGNPANDPENTNYPIIGGWSTPPGITVVGRNDGTNSQYNTNYPKLWSFAVIPPDDTSVPFMGGGISIYSKSV
jgi:hypothetical protein